MTAPWWGREASVVARKGLAQEVAPAAAPELVLATSDAVFQEVYARTGSYTPEWTNRRPGDAGYALLRLFSEEMEPVLQRLNQLPEKSFVEFLSGAGVQPLPPTPATALLQFSVADGAPQSVLVPQGFQVGAAPATGGGGMVIFETNADIYAAPAKIKSAYVFTKDLYHAVDVTTDGVAFQPFGVKPRPGTAFLIGLDSSPDAFIGPQISLAVQIQTPSAVPAPVATGGVTPLPAPLAPLLQWDALDGTDFKPVALVNDETQGLLAGGVITLDLPDEWKPGIPQGSAETAPLRWLRLQISYGAYSQPPVLLSLKVNVVRATAAQSFHDEVLTPVAGSGGRMMSLSHVPVLAESLHLAVDDTADLSFSSDQDPQAATLKEWKRVDDLSQASPDAEVYTLDPVSGIVTFGDGVQGKAVPPGFRNVIATSYQMGSGAAGAVAANKITNPVNSLPFISGVTNPWAASGGTDAESQEQARQDGPSQIRARGRAVALADYEILSLRTAGAQVKRAHAVSGFHPAFPGTPIPGVVTLFVVPALLGIGPPRPDEETLRAVSTSLSSQLAPAGVEIVAAAPVYHTVRVETTIVISPAANRGEVVRAVLNALDIYLDPLQGGENGDGWPFGGTLFYPPLVRRLLTITGVTAVSRLAFVVDGVRGNTCADFPIPENSLVWPVTHQVLALAPGEE